MTSDMESPYLSELERLYNWPSYSPWFPREEPEERQERATRQIPVNPRSLRRARRNRRPAGKLRTIAEQPHPSSPTRECSLQPHMLSTVEQPLLANEQPHSFPGHASNASLLHTPTPYRSAEERFFAELSGNSHFTGKEFPRCSPFYGSVTYDWESMYWSMPAWIRELSTLPEEDPSYDPSLDHASMDGQDDQDELDKLKKLDEEDKEDEDEDEDEDDEDNESEESEESDEDDEDDDEDDEDDDEDHPDNQENQDQAGKADNFWAIDTPESMIPPPLSNMEHFHANTEDSSNPEDGLFALLMAARASALLRGFSLAFAWVAICFIQPKVPLVLHCVILLFIFWYWQEKRKLEALFLDYKEVARAMKNWDDYDCPYPDEYIRQRTDALWAGFKEIKRYSSVLPAAV